MRHRRQRRPGRGSGSPPRSNTPRSPRRPSRARRRACRRSAPGGLVALDGRTSASIVDAEASLPTLSSTTWTSMWARGRKTTRRGRSVVPVTFLRTRAACRRLRETLRLDPRSEFRDNACSSLTCLSGLAADVLARVPDAPPPCTGSGACAACGCWQPPRRPTACRCPDGNFVGLSTWKLMPSGRPR